MKVINLFNLTQILNTIQLIIGVICFFVHVVLLSIQRKVIKQMKMNEDDNNKVIVYTQPSTIDINHTTCYADAPPRYEEVSTTHMSSE